MIVNDELITFDEGIHGLWDRKRDSPATVLLPTPPLPLATTTICLTPLILDFWGGAPLLGMVGGGFGLRFGIPYGRWLSVAAGEGSVDVRAGFHGSAPGQRHAEFSVGGGAGGERREGGEDAALWWSGEMYTKATRAKSHSVLTKIILSLVRHFPITSRPPLLPHHQKPPAPHQTPSPHHPFLRAHYPPPPLIHCKVTYTASRSPRRTHTSASPFHESTNSPTHSSPPAYT